tara:strand:- start:337 stop:579 length:243 start_codon:yes stop_codon:yes gene_type:complete
MDKKITYVLEIRSPYMDIDETISSLFYSNKPLYIAKDVGADFEGGELEYIADITKIKEMPNGFVIHVNSKEQIMEINTDD